MPQQQDQDVVSAVRRPNPRASWAGRSRLVEPASGQRACGSEDYEPECRWRPSLSRINRGRKRRLDRRQNAFEPLPVANHRAGRGSFDAAWRQFLELRTAADVHF
jgi:hypothetical protein